MSEKHLSSSEPQSAASEPCEECGRTLLQDERADGGAMWGWIAGIAVLILIVFVLIGGWNGADKPTQAKAQPVDLGSCAMTGATDVHGARITLMCPNEKRFTFVKE